MNTLIDELDMATNPDDVEQGIALFGCVPEAKYHARLVEAADDSAGGYDVVRCKFEILTKPYAGKLIEETLFLNGSDDAKTAKARQRKLLFCHRLGLLKKEEVNGSKRYVLVPGRLHLRDCLGEQCVIDVKLEDETFVAKQGSKAGQKLTIKKNKLQYEGVFQLDDPKVRDVPRATDIPAPPRAPAAAAPVNLDGI